MSAVALKNSKTAIGAYLRRISRRKGMTVAVFSTARKLATLAFRMLKYGQDYVDIGEESYEAQFQTSRLNRIKSIAKSMGYEIIQNNAAD